MSNDRVNREAVLLLLGEEQGKKNRGEKYSPALIEIAEVWLRINPYVPPDEPTPDPWWIGN